MNVKSLDIKNFRCFAKAYMGFHPQFNLIVGINGTGKTTILEALRIMIGSLFLKVDKVADKIFSPSIVKDDVRLASLEMQYPVRLGAVADIPEFKDKSEPSLLEENEITWYRTLETNGGKTTSKDAKMMVKASEAMQASIREINSNITIPLVAYFSTDRFKKEKRDIGVEPDGSRLRGYYNSLDSLTNVKFFLDIWFTETLWELQSGKTSLMLSAVKQSIKNCLEDCQDAYFDIKLQELVMIQRNPSRQLPYHLLSDGVRSMFAMVMEIAFRCYLLNPHLGENAPLLTPGVVLIDEIDLHLHPEWQMRVVNDLQNAFPKIQFIASTHAPLVVGSLSKGKIICVDNNQVYDFSLQYGKDANYILREMGALEMPIDIKDLISKYYALIQRGLGLSDEAKELREKLNLQLGKDHPELQRAD
ncbi:MAG: AAA family ATPase, partial [Muribaculaceae bacterium]|nr:AAA family ATPase [Muribaculaceae bacterium]